MKSAKQTRTGPLGKGSHAVSNPPWKKPGEARREAADGDSNRGSRSAPRRISRISRLLSEAGLRLRKSMGQNFLVNQGVLEKIAAASGATSQSLLIEIGSGLGNLTELLARKAAKVLAVELDDRFQPIHQRELSALQNLIFLYADFMELDLVDLVSPFPECDVRIVGNIPYHITSPILFKIMASDVPIAQISILMQREVAQRIVAKPGSSDFGILSAKVQSLFDAEIAFTVAPGSFLPPPKVHSALVLLTPRQGGALVRGQENRRDFFSFIDACFAQRRKILSKSLEAGSRSDIPRSFSEQALDQMGLSHAVRGEQLGPPQLLQLFRQLGCPRLQTIRKDYSNPAGKA